MANPAVDTFEHDIADEIRQKEASISDIAAAVGDIGVAEENKPVSQSTLVTIVTILIICGILGVGYIGYIYYNKDTTPITKEQRDALATQQKKLKGEIKLNSVSPTLDRAIGTFLTKVEKNDVGYSMSILSYSPVFSYMIKNEAAFGDEIALAVGNSTTSKSKATTTQAEIVVSTSSVSTSTLTHGTSTKIATTSPEESLPTSYIFSDVTISNQNMRIATSLYGTVVYAFIGTQNLVISSSTDGILTLRSNTFRK